MPAITWNPARAKVQLKLSIQRLRLLSAKKSQLAKVTRREIGGLLEQNRIETAKIKVEGVMGDDQTVELLEVLELYCELLLARFGILETVKEIDPAVAEAVAGVIHAAPRTELKELHTLREMLMSKYGRQFSIECMDNDPPTTVSPRIISKLSIKQPPSSLVDLYLHEIAKSYGVNWFPEGYIDPSTVSTLPPPLILDDSTTTATHPATIPPLSLPSTPSVNPIDAPNTVIIRSGVIPPSPIVPSVIVPSITPSVGLTTENQKNELDAFEALSRRFAELKKR